MEKYCPQVRMTVSICKCHGLPIKIENETVFVDIACICQRRVEGDILEAMYIKSIEGPKVFICAKCSRKLVNET